MGALHKGCWQDKTQVQTVSPLFPALRRLPASETGKQTSVGRGPALVGARARGEQLGSRAGAGMQGTESLEQCWS